MRPQSIKTFQDVCLVAYLWNMIAFVALDATNTNHAWSSNPKIGGTVIDHFGPFVFVMAIFLVVLAPIMGAPFWLGLLVSRRKSKFAKYLLYTMEAFLVMCSIGCIIQLSVLGYFEQTMIGLSFVIEALLIGAAIGFLSTPQSKQWLERY